ncbi:GAF domain-containing sensor histidine kinase [Nitriliruptor alkaliphilus]|uniref:sensor histidine kinase n=1 Tax=Nitriliruptor alkaliphilus TaxID=427918 RepID=UPI0006961631|nr:GAF domain-containing sensor histidine kinase [Nitriliruptor alkaliphilus]
MESRARLPTLLLCSGAAAVLLALPILVVHGGTKELPWLAAMMVFLAAAGVTWKQLPTHPAARWFAVVAGMAALTQALDAPAVASWTETIGPRGFALVMLVQQLGIIVTVTAIAHLFGTFPDGRPPGHHGRTILRGLWGFLVFPPVVLLTRPTVLMPNYYDLPELGNPFAMGGLALVGQVAGAITTASQALFAVGVVMLVVRYRTTRSSERRRIRWLLLPAVLAVFAVGVDLLGGPDPLLILLWIAVMVLLPITVAVALLRPDLFDVDTVLRKSMVYGLLWLLIAGTYVAAAAGLGVVAGQRFPVGVAITLTVVATLVFQPARRWLEGVADRRVFGRRADPARLISKLGAALEETVELESLLPRMADTLQEGLGLRWARVRLHAAAPLGEGRLAPSTGEEEPVLSIPVLLGDERLGVVECGPKTSGAFTEDDEAVVMTLARQAALAVRNVRLTAELQRSRARLVRAQDAERRRLERNIHDGVQQDLVALIGHTAHVRSQLERDLVAAEQALTELQEGLRGVIGDLRELAHGIHPSVLGDRGLLAAVEALAARSALPVSVRADPSLRGQRFAEEVEGASYFAIAEALANVGKHAAATHAEVMLARNNGSLHIEVRDDGAGFDPSTASGEGLPNLADRMAALGGRLDVISRAGGGTTVRATLGVGDG